MLSDAVKYVAAVVELLGSDDITDDEIEERVLVLTGDKLQSRRLIDWIPEVFGYVVISHLGQFTLDVAFQAKRASGEWQSFDYKCEPIAGEAGKIAMAMFHDGPRDEFRRIAERSGMLAAASKALNEEPDFEGAISGPALIGIPAEVYTDMNP